MKRYFTLILLLFCNVLTKSQQFVWAHSYEIMQCNEVAALAIDTNNNVFISGVYNASPFVPYTGNAYCLKTDPDGDEIWTNYFTGSLQIADMAAIGDKVVLTGESSGPFTYNEQQYGPPGYTMFVFVIDAEGNEVWNFFDETRYGTYNHLSVDKLGRIALQTRGQSNISDWVMLFDADGTILNTKQISPTATMIVDIAYINNRVYLNGGFNGPGGVLIDTILIEVPPVEGATFVLALDSNLVAAWASVDTAFNNVDGRIVANGDGVYAYFEVIQPPFILATVLKKFSYDGQFLGETDLPVYNTGASLYPDLVSTPSMVAIFAANDFNFTSNKLILYDHFLNLMDEQVIDGPTDLYSGQVAAFGEDIFVAHVYSGQLSFDDDLILPYEGTGKLPFIAKYGDTTVTTGIRVENTRPEYLSVYPNPAENRINIRIENTNYSITKLEVLDLTGIKILKKETYNNFVEMDVSLLSGGIYLLQVDLGDGTYLAKKIVIR